MTSVEGIAPAKVNLCLHLTGLREDGYHLLESLVVFAGVGDVLRIRPAPDLRLSVTGPFAQGVPTDQSNLVLQAAELLRRARGCAGGAAITLEKHLPHGGGIGGGSSDAACAIRLLSELWHVDPLTAEEALALGADVPVCMAAPQPMLMRGIGDVLEPAPALPAGWLVLVNPGVAVPTRKVFALHDRLYGFSPLGMETLEAVDDADAFERWLLGQRNDLSKVTSEDAIAPVVGQVLERLRQETPAAEMSGSGSTCWGWFRDAAGARAAAVRISATHPDWWVAAAEMLRG